MQPIVRIVNWNARPRDPPDELLIFNERRQYRMVIGPRTPEQLRDLLAGADVRLDTDTLDAIDELVAPGAVVYDFDRGWTAPWMTPEARRR